MDAHPHKSTTHEEMFFHIREWLGDSADPSKIPLPKYRGATVFARKEADGYWYASVALCSVKDVFQKRVGRSQARRRYFLNSDLGNYILSQKKPTYDSAQRLARVTAQ